MVQWAMTDAAKNEHGLEFAIGVGATPGGAAMVTLNVLTCGISNAGFVIPPALARELGPQLAKELANAADTAEAENRKRNGLVIVPGLPDTLRK